MTPAGHRFGYRCTGRQASCGCGFRGKVHKGTDALKKARADLVAHADEVRKGAKDNG